MPLNISLSHHNNAKTPKDLKKVSSPNKSVEKLNMSVDSKIRNEYKQDKTFDEKLNFSDNEVINKKQNKSEFDINLSKVNGAIDDSHLGGLHNELLEISEEKTEQSGNATSYRKSDPLTPKEDKSPSLTINLENLL